MPLPRLAVLLAACLGAVAIAVPASSADPLTGPETVYLDTFEAPSDGLSGPVSTAGMLADDQFYVATVTGTFSAYRPDTWDGSTKGYHVCGTPDSQPLLPSAGRPSQPAGQDAEFIYAIPVKGGCPRLPEAYPNFQIDTGNGFSHPVPIGGVPSGPTSGHSYRYLMRGHGTVGSFGQFDTYTADDNGVYTIDVRPATAADCGGDPACLATAPSGPGSAPNTSATAQNTIRLPAGLACGSRRRFRIRVVTHQADPVVAATVRVNGRQLRVRVARVGGRDRLISVLNFRRLPRSIVSVTIVARTQHGRTLVGHRRYHLCYRRHLHRKAPNL